MEKNRLYRAILASDLPKVVSGSLKAYREHSSLYIPATLIGTKFSGGGFGGYRPGWVIESCNEQFLVFGLGTIFVDVTPEKRYAVWNHTMQRFQMTNEGLGFTSKAEAEAWIETKGYGNKKMYVVEWEIKNND